MDPQEFFLALLGVGLVLVAVYFGWRQFKTLDWLKQQQALSAEDRSYYRRQVFRRLVGCLLMLVLAVQIGGVFYYDLFGGLKKLSDVGDAAQARGQQLKPEDMTPEQHDFLRFQLTYLIGMLMVVLLTMIVAVMEMMAIRRYGMRQRRRIREDRQAMLERQLPNLRWHRGNGAE